MRLRLRLADAPDLADLPWEFLYNRRLNRFLAESRRSPLVRYLDLPDPPRPLTVDGPLRLLVMISNPRDWPRLDVEQEWSVLTGALAQPLADGRVVIERMTANMSTLRRRLRREAFHVFHFIGHGQYRADWGDGVLVMEDAEGGPHEVTGEELGGLLNEYDATRLAVLNACEGALTDASDPFAGMAQSLIQQGLPAVVAMQFEITDEAAIIFARELYGATADGYPVEAALAEARGAIRDAGNPTEWGTPVLYSRAPDGRLFDWSDQGTISKTDRKVREEANRKTQDEDAGRKTLEDQLRVREQQGDGETNGFGIGTVSAAADDDDFKNLLNELRINVLEKVWPNRAAVSVLLYDAGLDPDNYPILGNSRSQLWESLLPTLESRQELDVILRIIRIRVGKRWQTIIDPLVSVLEDRRRSAAAVHERVLALMTYESAWELLRNASDYQLILLRSSHPSAARIAGMQEWIQGCVRAVHDAQRFRAPVARRDEIAHLDEIAAKLTAVADTFSIYASMLDKFRSADKTLTSPRPQSGLAAIAEDERLLLNFRAALRTAIQELISALEPGH